MMNVGFMRWSGKRINSRIRCRVERSFNCIPLEDDEICRACFEEDTEPTVGAAPVITGKKNAGGNKEEKEER
jgi:hypothetical protein